MDYKELVNRIKKAYLYAQTDSTKAVLEDIFPELAESEDERIRKALIRFHKSTIDVDGIKGEDILSWLEKQGEQNPADKVVPKFHKGDWIVWQNKCYKVNYNGCGYELIDQNGLSTSLEYGTVDKSAHLWTIKNDAKDGDVLYYKSDCGVEFIVMSNGVNKSNNIDSYFRYNSNDGFGIDIPNVFSAKQDNITPATKEQRDTLMKAMADAGWEFDFENKELKKIEPKQEWSEEDEVRLQACLDTLQAKSLMGKVDTTITMWLKSLKERIGG